jgi:hypothetical protein
VGSIPIARSSFLAQKAAFERRLFDLQQRQVCRAFAAKLRSTPKSASFF